MDKAALERKGYSVAALRALARKELPRMLFDMVDGAAGDEITMRNNEAALAAIELVADPARRRADARPVGRAVRRDAAVRRSSSARPALRACCGRTPNSPRRARRRGSERSTARATPRPRPSKRSAPRRRDRNGCRSFSTRIGPHRRVRRARRSCRLQGSHPHCRQPGDGGPRPRCAQRHDLPVALGSTQRPRLSESSRMGPANARDAVADLRQLRRSGPRSAPSAR